MSGQDQIDPREAKELRGDDAYYAGRRLVSVASTWNTLVIVLAIVSIVGLIAAALITGKHWTAYLVALAGVILGTLPSLIFGFAAEAYGNDVMARNVG